MFDLAVAGAIIVILLGAIGYLVKRIIGSFDRGIDKTAAALDRSISRVEQTVEKFSDEMKEEFRRVHARQDGLEKVTSELLGEHRVLTNSGTKRC
jgi:hypothetical protein